MLTNLCKWLFFSKKHSFPKIQNPRYGNILIVFIISSLLIANAQHNQKITFSSKNIPLKTVVNQIEKQTDYLFVYNEQVIDINQKVNINAKNNSVEEILNSVLSGTNVTYSIEGKNIVLRKKQNSEQDTNQSTPTTRKIKGMVTDNSGMPIIGATVLDPQTKNGTITDFNGNFSIEVNDNSVLQFTYIGFNPTEIKVGNQQNLNVQLTEGTLALDEVVVVGYGTQSTKLLTTSVGHMKPSDIKQGADYNVAKMLQGRVAGINVSSASGKPGSAPNILIRGIGSLNGGSSPLYVVDGIPSESMPVLNANDIERMDVLKDASATAIYGSRANSGVIIITTKSGKKGKTNIDFNGQFGIGVIAKDIPVANVQEYKQVMQTVIDNTNVQQGSVLDFFVPAEIQETNWLNEIYRQPAYSKTGSIMLSGGDDNTLFYTSFGYIGQQGAVRKSDYNQYNIRTKFDHKINDIFKLKLNFSVSYSRFDQVEDSDTSLKVIRTAREEQPWYNPYKVDGSYKEMGVELLRHNPVVLIDEEDWVVHKKQGVLGTAIEITPFRGFKYTPSVNLYGILDEVTKKITENHAPRRYNAGWGAIDQAKNVSFRYVIDNIFSYENEYKKLYYSLMAGHSFEKYEYETFGAKSDNYANEAFPSSSFDLINAGTNIYPGSIGYNAYAIESYLGRVALNYDNKYILNSTIRRDGSSRFSKLQRYGTFPSLSFAWRVTNEEFMPKTSFLKDLKLRTSWGITGSMAGIGNFAALSLVSSGGSSYNGASGFRISQDAQNLTWEKANQVNLGFDAELFSGRMNVVFDAFYSKTTDLLYNKPVFSTTGYTSIPANIGALQNKGIEFLISSKVLTNGEFKWDLNFNMSFVQNKLLYLIDGQDMFIMPSGGTNLGGAKFALINGKPISAYYMLKMDGIYQKDSEVPEKLYAKGVRAGDVKYNDFNGDGDISDDDRQYVGKAIPDFYGGLTSNMQWRNFELSIFSQFSVGGKIFSAWKGGGGSEGTEHLGVAYSTIKAYKNGELIDVLQFYNVSQYAATHYWRGEGTSNTVPRPVMKDVHTGYAVDYNTQTSTRYLEDASFFKIKSVTLSYIIPKKSLSKLKINDVRLYAGVDNLLTFTPYSGYDPEFSYQSNPGGTNYGVDWGELPTLRNWFVGVNIHL